MALLDFFTDPINQFFATAPIESPEWLLLIPLAAIILFFIVRYSFVKVQLDNMQRRHRRWVRFWVYMSRLLITALIALALATPYVEMPQEQSGNPQITLLIDESLSMNVMDTQFVSSLQSSLEERIPTTVRTIASGEQSDLGDSILDNLEPGSHVLLISDGNSAQGTTLEDVAFFATNELNASISAISLETAQDDASVFITGPEKVVAGTSNTYIVHITKTHERAVPLTVRIDGQIVFDETTTQTTLAFEKELGIGDHRIEASITQNDFFADNNRFYKTVTVLEKPRILLISDKDSPIESILNELYSVTKQRTIPQDISQYYAIVANDVDASQFTNLNGLHEFLLDEQGGYYGGGLVVIGGFNSFDRGGYQNSPIESILPVSVGKGEQKKGDDNIVIILDISGGTTGVRYEKQCDSAGNCEFVEIRDATSALDIIKAQAVNLISSEKSILATNKVGVIAFGVQGTLEETGSEDFQATDTVRIIEPLDHLYNNQADLQEKIPRLVGGGPSEIGIALQAAYDMLKTKQGQNNYVLLLTDGNVGPTVQKHALLAVENLQHRGVKVFTYGVGRNEQNVMSPFLTQVAQAGDGLYEGPVFTTRDVTPSRIAIQWGNPDQKGFGDSFGLITFSLTHFITRDLTLSATLNGFNQVTPKSNAKMLLTTDFGQPALSVSNYGNGRVAALTVFTGGGLGELLNAQNSVLITRTVNWAIGDPERKQDFFVDIGDARIGESTTAIIRSEETLNSESVELIKDGTRYTATFTPQTLGFSQFFGAQYATNYPREYQRVGMNPQLNNTVAITNGKLFSPEETDAIIEHVSELSRQQVVEREPLRWPFICAAVILFLIEILYRRLNQYKKE